MIALYGTPYAANVNGRKYNVCVYPSLMIDEPGSLHEPLVEVDHSSPCPDENDDNVRTRSEVDCGSCGKVGTFALSIVLSIICFHLNFFLIGTVNNKVHDDKQYHPEKYYDDDYAVGPLIPVFALVFVPAALLTGGWTGQPCGGMGALAPGLFVEVVVLSALVYVLYELD